MLAKQLLKHVILIGCCMSPCVPIKAQSPNDTPESYIADKVLAYADRINGVPSAILFQQSFGQFNRNQVDNGPSIPTVHILTQGVDCFAVLKAYIDKEDFGRRWDGSIDQTTPTGVGFVINLRGLDRTTVRIQSSVTAHMWKQESPDEQAVDINFKSSGNVQYAGWMFRCGDSENWQMPPTIPRGVGCYRILTGVNPFSNALTANGTVRFTFREGDRQSVVELLKSLFDKCAN
jgi:hypothetical protein